LLKLAGRAVSDPTNNLNGVVQDVWVRDDIVFAAPTDPSTRPGNALGAEGGLLVAEQGEVREELYGPTPHMDPAHDAGALADVKKWFEAYYTIQFANYPVDEHYMAHGGTAVECGLQS
jgi:formylmethanofuran dehydrogenase subunit A